MSPFRATILASLVLAVIAFWLYRTFFDAYHLAIVDPGVLYRDGVRNPRQFAAALRKVHPKTIVCLVDDQEITREPFVSELNECRRQGVVVVRLPIPLGGWPDENQVRQFLELSTDPAQQPVLVHCAQGVRRTGMMVAAYQESILHFDPDRAKAAMLRFGHSDRTVNDVKRFIDAYDPVGRRLTQTFPISSE